MFYIECNLTFGEYDETDGVRKDKTKTHARFYNNYLEFRDFTFCLNLVRKFLKGVLNFIELKL